MLHPAPPPEAIEAMRAARDHRVAHLRERLATVISDLTPERVAWAEERLHDLQDLFDEFIRGGELDAALDPIRIMCRGAVERGFTLDQFARMLIETYSARKLELLELMPDRTRELAALFRRIDEFEFTLYDEFSHAQNQAWSRREKEAAKLHFDFFHNLPFPTLIGSPDLVIREVNPAALDCIRIDASSVAGRPLADWLAQLRVPAAAAAELVSRLKETGRLVHEPVEVLCPRDGHPLHLLLTVNYLQDLEGRRVGFQAMVQDVTAQESLEREIRAYAAQMDSVFNSTPLGLIFVDSSTVIQRINAEACRLLNYPPPAEIERGDMTAFRERAKLSYKDPEGFMNTIREVYSDPENSKSGMLETVSPPRHVQFSANPARDAKGRPIGWLWIFSDVTDRIAQEKLRNDLTHMIVHDLKNPLTVIQGGAGAARRLIGDSSPKAAEALDAVRRGCDRMMAMIMNLLDIERLETGKLKPDSRPVDLAALLNQTVEIQRPGAGTRRLEAVLAPEAAALPFRADPALLERMLANLVGNSVKHTRPDGSIRLLARTGPGGGVQIAVEDDGAGIPKEYHGKIFEKFGQAEMRKQGGKTDTGLGLNFCKLAMEAHGGTISVESEPGRGSVFLLDFPPESSGPGRG